MASAEEVFARQNEINRDSRTFTSVRPDGPDQRRSERRPNPAAPGPVTPTS
ncbi:MAG TPA: hypothetical protein VJ547_12125 [Candidatus Thermoplasmatota archaeon]|nr:hypothetical protein [Candidatus Thermoplasmatota archaeon]